MANSAPHPIAYFSMEVALDSRIPTYSGGLGVLAGDTIRSAADRGLPLVGVSLLYRNGYFFQELDDRGRQIERPVEWSPDDWLETTEGLCRVELEGRAVAVRAWRTNVSGVHGHRVPVLLLDTNLPENHPEDRSITDVLYGGDSRHRLRQEAILGIGGLRMLRALGYEPIARYHMNEGHSALLALELLAGELARPASDPAAAIERVKHQCVFTTHTPVPAGHDNFPLDLVRAVLGAPLVQALATLDGTPTDLHMTRLALRLSGYVNGVAKRHGEVSRSMFPGYPISSITNGVHSATWTAPSFQALYDRYIPNWRHDSFSLRYASSIPDDAVWEAHLAAKASLVDEVNERANGGFDRDVFTLGFARRATAYKRPALLLSDPETLRAIAARHGGLQVIYAGKAHPRDDEGKALIEKIVATAGALRPDVRIAYLPNYDMGMGRVLTAGVDVWLNTPRPPHEASGTSGMKAAHNGVPTLSVLDGWWIEGHVEGGTGWAIGTLPDPETERGDEDDARDLYRLLDETILPLYHSNRGRWIAVMRLAIALNASFFNTQRMLEEYASRAYRNGSSPLD